MSSFRFYFRPSTRKGDHLGKIYLRVVHGGLSRSITTDYTIGPSEWDPHLGQLRLVGSRERKQQLIEYEERMHGDTLRIEGVIRQLERRGEYSVDDIMARYKRLTTENGVNAYAEQLAAVLEKNGYERTARAYRSAAARISKFKEGGDMNLEQLNSSIVGEFQQALKADGKSMNTISFYMRTLRAIYNKATRDGRIIGCGENPFSDVYTGIEQTPKPALTEDEFSRLLKLNPADGNSGSQELPEHLRSALAMFLFCYHSRGMRFVDMAYLEKKDYKEGTIRYRRSKTGQQIEVKVLPIMRRIIDWFAPQVADSKYLFPIITDDHRNPPRLQYESGLRIHNDRLKNIAQLSGINKRLSSNSAQHGRAKYNNTYDNSLS